MASRVWNGCGNSDVTTAQLLSVGIITLMMIALVWGRLRYDMIAVCALLLAVAAGIVPFAKASEGLQR
ncbi:hypothetical protein SAZ10_11280 [Mesorhizobium sp. BAC0120]|uniref:hypothetical protein n=1 Tax=Mesorhizobium sp. BAC0120 TaxID=3090670 RepID=UPI00298C59D4|nr:hypothetical protein [Mesorhizobium sp. BAC0120]MDW6022335.1 hypothetical protein [Mesorhizobium sp. BAC0120]